MKKVAIIQFPGTNSEYETRRAVREAGMDGRFFRWNQNPSELDTFDGFVIAGGFSYEDRGRSGVIASMDPIMTEIKKQAAKGKPVLGICNGAQVLVESGLIPGGTNNSLLMCLAKNRKVKNGQLIGTGFYNENVYVKCDAPGRTAFTLDYDNSSIAPESSQALPEKVPAAHGEGRFTTTINGLLEKLQENKQIVFRYCDSAGEVDPDFPVNPNGAMDNAAAICNPAGNVMAIMPHPERAFITPMPRVFSSMRKYMESLYLNQIQPSSPSSSLITVTGPQLGNYHLVPNTIQIFIELIITDNEAQTLQNALNQKGFKVNLRRWIHYEVSHAPEQDQSELVRQLKESGELWNPNKERESIVVDALDSSGTFDHFTKNPASHYFLVRDMEDSAGASKTALQIKQGNLWELSNVSAPATLDAILATNIFANPHAQLLLVY